MLRRSFVAFLPLLWIAVACSDSPGSGRPAGGEPGGGPGGASDTTPQEDDPATDASRKDICATLDYGHDRSNADYFLRFDDDAAALKYSEGFLASSGITSAAEIATDARLLRLVGRVFDGFKRVFPRETMGLDAPPRVIVVQESGLNAFAGYDERPEIDKAPWLFWVHQATVTSSRPDGELEGLYAHELAHLILRNLLPQTRAKIRTHYRVPGSAEHGVIGAFADDDPVVRPHADELRTIGALVGREYVFGSMPLSAFEDSEYQSLLATLAKNRPSSADARTCQAADAGLERARAFYKATVSIHDLTLELTPKQIADLGALERATTSALRSCYASVKKSIFELKIEDRSVQVLVNGTPASLQTILDPTTAEHKLAYGALMANPVERQVDGKAGETTIERLLEVVSTLHGRAAALTASTELPIDELRVFDLEEDADDAAVRVLRAIGDDSLGAARLFVGQMPDPDACLRVVNTGGVPRYGRFIDSHNATCWRAFHATDLARELSRCPVPSSAPSAQSSAAALSASSAADDAAPAMRLVQRPRLPLLRALHHARSNLLP
ncbi:MAG: hypothetical protein KF850_39210 [Labilithrix sp.]|nr:hypothetical protein [Labilithrix sp.]